MLRLFAAASILAAALVPAAASAADEQTAAPDPCGATNLLATTDRPTFGTNPCVVKAVNAIFEAGYANSSTGGRSAASNASFPTARIRAGLLDGLELVVDVPSEQRLTRGGVVAEGLSDAGFGLKYEIGHGKNFVYGVAGEAVLPSGSDPFTAQSPSYNGSAQFGYGILPRVGIGLTLGFADAPNTGVRAGGNRRGTTFDGAFALGVGITPSTKITAEIAHVRNVGEPAQTYGDLFVQQAVTQRYLVDINVGTAFNAIDGRKRHYLGAGIAVHP